MPHFHQGHQLVTRVDLMPQPNMFFVFIYFVLSHLNIHTALNAFCTKYFNGFHLLVTICGEGQLAAVVCDDKKPCF